MVIFILFVLVGGLIELSAGAWEFLSRGCVLDGVVTIGLPFAGGRFLWGVFSVVAGPSWRVGG